MHAPCRPAQRSAGRAWPSFAPENRVFVPSQNTHGIPSQNSFSRYAHTHALAHAVNDRTDMPRRGQLVLLAAQPPHRPCRWQDQRGRGFLAALVFNFLFRHKAGTTPGGSSPRPEGPEGAYMAVAAEPPPACETLNARGLRSLRRNRLKPMPGVDHPITAGDRIPDHSW